MAYGSLLSIVAPSVRLSPNAMIRVPRRRGGPATVTEKLHEPVRLNESVATHSACVTPTGNVVPEGGVQATDTVPWPFRLSGSAYVTAAPTLVRAETVTGSGQVTSGASAMGGLGGVGVGALGVPLHAAQQVIATSVRRTLIVPPPWFFSVLAMVNGKLPAYGLNIQFRTPACHVVMSKRRMVALDPEKFHLIRDAAGFADSQSESGPTNRTTAWRF